MVCVATSALFNFPELAAKPIDVSENDNVSTLIWLAPKPIDNVVFAYQYL